MKKFSLIERNFFVHVLLKAVFLNILVAMRFDCDTVLVLGLF